MANPEDRADPVAQPQPELALSPESAPVSVPESPPVSPDASPHS